MDTAQMAQTYQCSQCDWIGDRSAAVAIEDPASKTTPGQTYTDRECPQCGYRCFPAKERKIPPFPLVGLKVDQDEGTEAWANIVFPGSKGEFAYQFVGNANMFDRNTNKKHATLFAAAGELLISLQHAVKIIREHVPPDALGMNAQGDPDVPGGFQQWPLRDEYLHEMERSIAKALGDDGTAQAEAEKGTT